ncbi:MAG: tetratricopeptide repeat protein [Deltaproteobacteria bacterium]|nr:tetratricopeptide repeat protein [Deltaproteobacteria bacterium]
MDLKLFSSLLKKYNISTDQKFQIRQENGVFSKPLSIDEIARGIVDQTFSAQDQVSPYPEERFKPLAAEPLFYDLLFSILQKTELTQIQKEEITRVLKVPQEEKIEKRKVTPSLITPQPSQPLSSFKTSMKKAKNPKKGVFFILAILLFVGGTLGIFLMVQKPSSTSSQQQTIPFISVKLPPETVLAPNPEEAKKHYDEAWTLYQKDTLKTYQEALEHLQEASKANPQDAKALSLLAKTYLYLWDLSKKDDAYLNDISKMIVRAESLKTAQVSVQQAKALWHFRKKEPALSLEILEKLKVDSADGESELIQGEVYFDLEKYDFAIQSLEKAFKLSPHMARAPYVLGKSYQKTNNPEKAYEVYWTGLAHHPDHALSRLEASLIDIETFNNLKKAEGNLLIVTQFPALLTAIDLARAHYFLGWIYEEEKQLDFALKEYKKATQLDTRHPLYVEAYQRIGKDASKTKRTPEIQEESLYFLNIGKRYLEENRLVDAIAQFKAALEMDPKNYLALYQLGQVSEKQKKLKEALAYYDRAIAQKGNHVDSYVALANIYIHYYRFKKAIQYIEKIKSIQPRSGIIYVLSGKFYERNGNTDKAIDAYLKAIQLTPKSYEAHLALGQLFREKKLYSQAEKYFFKALEISPGQDQIQTEVALLYFDRGLKAQAVNHLKKLSAASPLNTQYLSGLGKLYALNENYSFAKETYLKALDLDPQHIDTLEGLADLYVSIDELQKAIETYKSLIQQDPSNAKWYFKRAKIQFESGNLQDALDEFKLTTQINDYYPLVHFYMGQTAMVLQNFRLAQTELKKEISINPHLKEPYLLLADLQAHLRSFDEAQENYKMYIRLDPNNPKAYFHLGRIHELQQRFDTAIEFYKTAIDKDTDFSEAYFHLGLIYKHLDRKSEAISALEQFMRVSPDAPNIAQIKEMLQELKGSKRSR